MSESNKSSANELSSQTWNYVAVIAVSTFLIFVFSAVMSVVAVTSDK